MIAALDALDPDDRIPIPVMLELLQGAVALTGDPDLGLKAAREVSIGDTGVLEHMVSAAPNVRAAVELVGRFVPLINEALQFSLRVEADEAIVRLDSLVALPRAAVDFQQGAFYVAARHRASLGATPVFDVLFTHARPEHIEEYERTFAPGRLRFGAAFNGFTFDRRHLELPLPAGDVTLHGVLREYAERVLADLPRSQGFTEKVRSIIVRDLAGGAASATRTAELLHVGRRTLTRKLRQEGTTFTELLDDVRRRAALQYVGRRDLPMAEIAFLLGFSEAAPFHRAFKRWNGQTPVEYRQARKR
jgi:AraC-like DNA-binding protein